MKLWTDEIEALRAEGREVVDSGFAAMMRGYGPAGEAPTDVAGRVRQQRQMIEQTYVPVPEGVDTRIAGVRCRVFRPAGPASAVYLHFHGGGMIVGAPEMNDAGNRGFAERFGMAVVSVDYRLAPEHPFPAGPDDGVAVAQWLLEHGADEFGSSRLLTGGESAGG